LGGPYEKREEMKKKKRIRNLRLSNSPILIPAGRWKKAKNAVRERSRGGRGGEGLKRIGQSEKTKGPFSRAKKEEALRNADSERLKLKGKTGETKSLPLSWGQKAECQGKEPEKNQKKK